jgi:hypothetical protein
MAASAAAMRTAPLEASVLLGKTEGAAAGVALRTQPGGSKSSWVLWCSVFTLFYITKQNTPELEVK